MSVETATALMPWVDASKIQANETGTLQNGSTPSLPLPTDPIRLKKFVRKGQWPVNHAVRHELWHHICMQNVVVAGSVYNETAKALFGEEGQRSGKLSFSRGFSRNWSKLFRCYIQLLIVCLLLKICIYNYCIIID